MNAFQPQRAQAPAVGALVVAALVAAFLGCKSGGSTELLERELRCQEDRIFKLQDELDDAYFALETSRRENQSLKEEMAGGDRGAGARFSPAPRARTPNLPKVEVPDLIAPRIEVPEAEAPAEAPPGDEAPPFRFVPKDRPAPVEPDASPKLNLPETAPSEPGSAAPDEAAPRDEAPRFEQTSHVEAVLQVDTASRTGSDASCDSADPHRVAHGSDRLLDDASTVDKLAINRRLTGGWNPNHKHGDEGVFVVFEPRDAQNQRVAAPGSVSMVAIDPALTGGAARVGRWDFTADEAALHFRTKGIGPGYQFELPWPSKPPINRDLRLFVRFETATGRRIEADTRIRVELYDGWTQKPGGKTADEKPAAECVDRKPSAANSNIPESRLVQSQPSATPDVRPAAQKPVARKPNRTATRPRWTPQR